MLSPTTGEVTGTSEEQLTSSQEEGEEQDLLGTPDNDLVVFKMVTVDSWREFTTTSALPVENLTKLRTP